jgi:nucleotide-binding universal stress UspA family protein
MRVPSRMLVPVDFSPCSRVALDYAAVLAFPLGASVDVLHVWQAPFSEPISGGLPPLAVFVRNEAERAMAELMTGLEARLGSTTDLIRGRLACGDPTEVILTSIVSGGYDLVVMGRHGRGRLHYLLMGSVAERVCRRAPCAVLTLHDERSPARISKPMPVAVPEAQT